MSTDSPQITVLTAAFNAFEGLRETAETVGAQSHRDFEHIVIDGGSVDGTVEFLDGLGDRVRWISEPDRGIADALNKGLAMARGDWVLALHAEDTLIGPDALAGAAPHLAQAAEDGIDILAFDVLFTTASGHRRLVSRGMSRKLEFKTTIPHQGAFIRRALHERIGSYDPSFRIAMDYEFFLRAGRAGATTRRIPEILAKMPDTGISSRRDWPSLRVRFAEERRAHLKHCPGPGMRAVYAVYWPLYLSYRRARTAVTR